MRSCVKKIVLFFSVVLVIGTFILFKHFSSNKIERVLKTQSYNYLPSEAKKYIEDIYNETGEIILTEKNKEDNTPYLNPDYVEYLKNGQSSEYGYIPEIYIVDHSYKDDVLTKQGDSNEKTSLSYYNLRDEGYITNIYNQGSEGLCWAFSSATSLESHLAIKSNKTKMLTFSEKQIDYATTKDSNSIDAGSNPFLYNNSPVIGDNLNEGGNMLRFANSTAIGISPVLCAGNCSAGTNYNSDKTINNNKYWKYDYYYNSKLSPFEITNIDNTEYSLNEFLFFNPLSTNNQSDVDSLVSLLKNQIVNNGSIHVSVGAYTNLSVEYIPTGTEKALNTDGKNVIYYVPYKWNPSSGMNHAVSIIGWDDNYTHNICLNKTDFEITNATKVGNNYSCTKGYLYTINGAWIIQNSWGNKDTFIYLPYNTMKSSYSSITNVSEVDYNNSYRATGQYTTFTKGNTKELLKKVKFFVNSYNKTIYVYYQNNEILISDYEYVSSYELLKSQKYSQPGLYTIDISENNIVLDENTEKFKLTFKGDNIKYDYYGSIHTSNVGEDKFIDLTNISLTSEKILTKCTLEDNKCIDEPHKVTFDDNNVFVVSGVSRNLSSNDNLTFKILNQNNEDVTNLFHVFRNYSVSNYIKALISYNSENVKLGTYIVEVYYNNNKYDELELELTRHNNKMLGIGTQENPYEIKTASDLNRLRNLNTKDNHYVLTNDLDLSYDTTNTKGLFYNSGAGWLPISDFYGSFNGNNHVISGVYINRPKDISKDPVGIFEKIFGTNNYIKNLIIKDVNINGYLDAGALAGKISITDEIEINNVSVIGGKVNSSYYNGGLIGGMNVSKGVTENVNCNMYNLYSNVSVGNIDTVFAGGIIGVVEGQKLNVTINDSASYSKVSGNGSLGDSAIGGIVGDGGLVNNLTINNAISAGSYKTQAATRLGAAVGYINQTNSVNISGVWYTNENKLYGKITSNGTETINNNTAITIDDLITNNYANYFEHKSQWTQPVIDGYKRFSMLTTLLDKFDFTKTIDDFEMKISETKSIYDLITPNNNNAKKIKWTYDDEYLTISSSGIITPKKIGVTTIHITSLYDGYKDDIQVTIMEAKKITFNSNNPSNEESSQDVAINRKFNLAKNLFTYKGHTFKEWNTKADGTGIVYYDEQLIESGINEDLKLYAIWSENQYKITFDGNGVTSNNNKTVDLILTYPSEGTISFGNLDFSKENYYIDNWNTKQDGTGIKFSAKSNDSIIFDNIPFDEQNNITLYAQWKEEKYTITFNANQGSGNMPNMELIKNVSANLSKNTFTRENYIFKNWNTKADGMGMSYEDEQLISITEDITLYAQWKKIKVKIIYCLDDSCTNKNEKEYEIGQTINIENCTIEMAGYYFDSWNTKVDGTGQKYSVGTEITLEKELVLYPIFKSSFTYSINDYSVDENSNTINKIIVGTTESSFKNHIKLGDNYSVTVDSSNNLIYTGSKTKIYNFGNLIKEFTNVVTGDITGDGIINSADLLKIRQHLIGVKPLNGIYFTASDINYDNTVNSADLLKIRQHLIGTKLIG